MREAKLVTQNGNIITGKVGNKTVIAIEFRYDKWVISQGGVLPDDISLAVKYASVIYEALSLADRQSEGVRWGCMANLVTIELKYSIEVVVESFQDYNKALQHLIYLKDRAPFVSLKDNSLTIAQFEFGTVQWVGEKFGNWVFENIHCHSDIRRMLEIAPGRAI